MSEEKKPENPNAFPSDHKWEEQGGGETHEMHTGMTLRDYFAGKAMQAHYHHMDHRFYERGSKVNYYKNAESIAREAYKMADAMLKAREDGK